MDPSLLEPWPSQGGKSIGGDPSLARVEAAKLVRADHGAHTVTGEHLE